MAYIDLTHTLSLSTTPQTIYPGHPKLTIEPLATIAQDGFNLHLLNLGTHTGTHIDAPSHFIDGGRTVDEIPLRDLVGKALVVDFAVGDVRLKARQKIEWDNLEQAWSKQWSSLDDTKVSAAKILTLNEAVDSGDYSMVLVNTGWPKRHSLPNLDASQPTAGSELDETHFFDHPYFSSAIARRLSSSKIRVFGTDTPNPDETPYNGVGGSEGYIFHEVFLGGGGLIAENLANLDRISIIASSAADWTVTIVPLKIEGADGSPVRAFAFRAGNS